LDKKLLRGRRLHHLLEQWDASGVEVLTTWIEVQNWEVSSFLDHPCMEKRATTRHGMYVLEWEFSSDTKVAWAWILSEILRSVDEAFCRVEEVRRKDKQQRSPVTEEEKWTAYEHLNESLIRLRSCFIGVRRRIFESLLYNVNLFDMLYGTGEDTEWEECK
jgi:hypothetical protein